MLGCAETGSGKTAAFALPILQHLSTDPYGIFAVILTPTRELAVQISEQIAAFGAPIAMRQALIIGGTSMTEQSLALSKLPHIVIATPGRLRHHIESANPPNLKKVKYLVLDEADRLLAAGFSSELNTITSSMNARRQTLLFSATLTSSLGDLKEIARDDALTFDLTAEQKVPKRLLQQYLFMPSQVKQCYLVSLIRKFISNSERPDVDEESKGNAVVQEIMREINGSQRDYHAKKRRKRSGLNDEGGKGAAEGAERGSQPSIIVFVSSCRRCEEVAALLSEIHLDCVRLNSMMSQTQRSVALSQFKSRTAKILVATDVASRGLDIPAVEYVINMDLPKVTADYIHRIGRTARAGEAGTAVSFVTQYDAELVHSIEAHVGSELLACTTVCEDDVVAILNTVSSAVRSSRLKLMESGFEERLDMFTKRRRKEGRKVLKKRPLLSDGN